MVVTAWRITARTKKLINFSSLASSIDLRKSNRASTLSLNDRLGSVNDIVEALKQCGRNKSLREGRHVHSQIIVRYGQNPSTLLANCLVQMYGLCGSTHDAQKTFARIQHPNHISRTVLLKAYSQNGQLTEAKATFDSMPHPDVVAWNTMIAAYAHNGCHQDAIKLFGEMQSAGPKLSVVTLICVLDACLDMQACHNIHGAIIEFQYEKGVTVGNALISMYGRCGETHEAEGVFMKMTEKNVITWSALIAANVHNGQEKKALEIFHDMLEQNIQPNNITCISIVDACAHLKDLAEGQKIHMIIVDCGYEKHLPIGNALVNMFGKCGSLPDAKKLFDNMDQRNVITWSALMGSYTQNLCLKEMLSLFLRMQDNGIKPDKVTFLSMLDTCASLRTLELGQAIHATIIENGYEQEQMLGNSLINFYGKCGDVIHARSVFYKLSLSNVVSWSTIIIVCAQNNSEKEAIDLYCQMQVKGINPNAVTLVSVLEASRNLSEGQLLHHSMVYNDCNENAAVRTSLINMYDKFLSFHDAKVVFQGIEQRDVVSWTAILAACTHLEHDNEVFGLFYQMQFGGFQPNCVTFICVLDTCGKLAAYEEGKVVHLGILNSGCDGDDGDDDSETVANALINMYGKCGSISDAISQFSVMQKRDLVSWNSLLSACAQNGCVKEAMAVFNQMGSQKVGPDGVTFVCILTACSHAGLIEDGLLYFLAVEACYGSVLNEEHFACVIDLYGRAGQIKEAEQLVRSMPFEGVFSALSSLLGACKIHGDTGRGISTAECMFHFNPEKASSYVDLSNILAAA